MINCSSIHRAMPRQWFEKVRTGCVTCKARKVKCDEARPSCLRCQTGSRICGGYRAPPPGSFSWDHVLNKRPSTISCSVSSGAESRGLDFFRCMVAPALASPLAGSFWARPVFQLAMQEPAVRNAVLAISWLYEMFDPLSHSSSSPDQHGPAIRYYNKALGQVATSTHFNTDTVLLICILFTCIEFLRGNAIAAIEHCRHGIHILRSTSRSSPDIAIIFRHLSIFPFFFGATPSDFPPLPSPEYSSQHIRTPLQAAESLDCLMSRSVRLLRTFDPYRLGILDMTEVPYSLTRMKNDLCQGLETWYRDFTSFVREIANEPKDENQALLRSLEMRWLVCKIWVHIASFRDETCCDAYQDQFERIVTLARQEATSRTLSEITKPKVFQFEMGLSPLLHFVVLKCRFLPLRLEALALTRTLGYARESLWDAALMYAIGSRVIEREHGINLSPGEDECEFQPSHLEYALPSDNQRITDMCLEDETQVHPNFGDSMMIRQRISFFVRHGIEGKVEIVRDWIDLPEMS
ncbi:hypothetical protein F5Y14DRAFT_304690 [Nemania sp. NC0429]|nr:hypothetical protein F5Y14DRAFT_304690 [Nemania sp. NC0429]